MKDFSGDNMVKRALITGVNGMDGSHLADFLLEKGYIVYGLERRTSKPNRTNTAHYNLAAQSFVGSSWQIPMQTSDVNALGVLRLLEAVREYQKEQDAPPLRFYQASTSEMFGKMVENPASESTPFYPRSPYGVAKLYGLFRNSI